MKISDIKTRITRNAAEVALRIAAVSTNAQHDAVPCRRRPGIVISDASRYGARGTRDAVHTIGDFTG